MTSRVHLIVSLVAVAVLGACGGDDSDGSRGFERYEEDGLAVEYPASWTVDRSAAQAGGVMAAERPFQLNDGRLVSDGRASVRGSDGAWRVDMRFSIERDDGREVPGRSVELIALKADEQFILTLAGPAGRMERLPVERIVGSLDLG